MWHQLRWALHSGRENFVLALRRAHRGPRELRQKSVGLFAYFRDQEKGSACARSLLLRTERRLGEMLAETVKAGNPQLSTDTTIAYG